MPLPSFAARFKASTGYNSGTQWTDQSGNGNHIISAGAGTWPTAVTANGLTCLRFNGTTNRLKFPNAVAWDIQNMSVYVVGRVIGSAGGAAGGAIYATSSASAILLPLAGGTANLRIYSSGYHDTNIPIGDCKTLIGFRATASSCKAVYGADEFDIGAIGPSNGTNGWIGSQDDAGTNALVGDIYEVFYTNAPWSNAELQSVRDYCVTTYGCGSGAKGDLIVYAGDSLMQGFNITAPVTDNYLPERVDYYLRTNGKGNAKWINFGKSGWVIGVPACTFVSADGTTATWTLTGHGFTTGDTVTMAGSSVGGYNGAKTITVTDANTFTFLTATTGTPTGTITASNTAAGATYGAFRGTPDTTVKSLYGDLADATSALRIFLAGHSGYSRVLIITDGGVNDMITGSTGDQCTGLQAYNRQSAYYAKAIAIGATAVSPFTITPPADDTTANTQRLDYNGRIVGHPQMGPLVPDVGGASSVLGPFANRTNATYFQVDHLHWTGGPTPSGDDAAALIVYNKMNPAVPSAGGGSMGMGMGIYCGLGANNP